MERELPRRDESAMDDERAEPGATTAQRATNGVPNAARPQRDDDERSTVPNASRELRRRDG
ncbi:MAG: hypothetical protein JNM17_26565 [Archangium sp.]|nr:hypothetical protein [Archangium sp.]